MGNKKEISFGNNMMLNDIVNSKFDLNLHSSSNFDDNLQEGS